MSDILRRLGAAPRTRREALSPSPVFLLMVALTLTSAALATRAPLELAARIGVFGLVAAGWVVSLCLHEYAHAVSAYRAGDQDVLSAGYLTLNPLRYAHPVLSLLLPVFFIVAGGIGLPGGAVYLHSHRFRSRGARAGVALAGPAVNVVLGVVLLLVAERLGRSLAGGTGGNVGLVAGLAFLGFLQLTAAVLNLLPVPGLDGWAAIEPFLAPATAARAANLKPYGMFAVIALLFVPQLNMLFFDLVYRLMALTGASPALAQLGRALFEFWRPA